MGVGSQISMACKAFSVSSVTNSLNHSSPFVSSSPSSLKLIHSNFIVKGLNSTAVSTTLSTTTNNFTWDEVIQIGHSPSDPTNLSGFFDKVSACKRNVVKLCEFVPFVVDEQVVGYVSNGFAAHLRRFQDVFLFPQTTSNNGHFGWHITLHPTLKSPEDRSCAVAYVIKCLGEDVIPGIRNELYSVKSCFGTQTFFSLERAAAPYFGIKSYAVHLNGYVEKDGEKFLWVAKRSKAKPTFPGLLDHLVAGGLPHGIPCGANMIKECEEEAGIPKSISKKVEPVGAVSSMDINGHSLERYVVFCYDLKLPEDFVPSNNDGEVESFRLIPVSHVANVVKKTDYFKPNCNLVIIDFLFRHGYICPEHAGYLKLLQSVRSGDCS